MAHLACLININTPLYDKHVYLLTANIRQSDTMRCCFPNEDTGAFIKASRVPLSGKMPLLYRHQKAFVQKRQIIYAKQTIRQYFSIRVKKSLKKHIQIHNFFCSKEEYGNTIPSLKISLINTQKRTYTT